jgi:hypothetical protein
MRQYKIASEERESLYFLHPEHSGARRAVSAAGRGAGRRPIARDVPAGRWLAARAVAWPITLYAAGRDVPADIEMQNSRR